MSMMCATFYQSLFYLFNSANGFLFICNRHDTVSKYRTTTFVLTNFGINYGRTEATDG